MQKSRPKTVAIVANRVADVVNRLLLFHYKSKAMKANTIQHNDPNVGGCCGGITDMGCC